MQELRLVLIVLGAVAIAALLLHGLWTSKKEKPVKFGEKPIGRLRKIDDAGFDQDGVGSVRVIKYGGDDKQAQMERKEPGLNFADQADDPLFADPTQPIVMAETNIATPSLTTCFDEQEEILDLEPVDVYARTAQNETVRSNKETVQSNKEALLGDVEHELTKDEPQNEQQAPSDAPPAQQLIVVNVQARNHQEFEGNELINFLEQYGMLFGDMEIYHRHADLAGTGKILFSVANMLNPGSFPLDSIQQFTTPGITFFMTLPCHGEAEQNFKLMLQTAQQVADQLGGLVTDENRAMMTPQRLNEYRDKIKKFHSYE